MQGQRPTPVLKILLKISVFYVNVGISWDCETVQKILISEVVSRCLSNVHQEKRFDIILVKKKKKKYVIEFN